MAILPGYNLIAVGSKYNLFNNTVKLAFNVSNLTNIIGLIEGNPRIEQVFAKHRENVFMARPILGRFTTLYLTLRL